MEAIVGGNSWGNSIELDWDLSLSIHRGNSWGQLIE